jgi:sugar phosphate isomerase/epimerase
VAACEPDSCRKRRNIVRSSNRREFLKTSAAALGAPAILAAKPAAAQLPISFSTLGCPKWDWTTVLDRAREWGYAAVELRGLQGQMDLTKCPEFAPSRLAQTQRELKDRNLRISDLGASCRLHEKDPKVRAEQLDEAKRFIELAHRVGAPYVRVFGDKWLPGEAHEITLERVEVGLRQLGGFARDSRVGVLIETHGDFTSSETLLRVLKLVALPNVGLLWDTHHSVVAGKEKPEETWKALGRYVRHTHIKDSKPEGDEVKYLLPGQGTVPLKEIVQVLKKNGYTGYYGFEWEKAWHPEIEEPEVAFPLFAKVIASYLESA